MPPLVLQAASAPGFGSSASGLFGGASSSSCSCSLPVLLLLFFLYLCCYCNCSCSRGTSGNRSTLATLALGAGLCRARGQLAATVGGRLKDSCTLMAGFPAYMPGLLHPVLAAVQYEQPRNIKDATHDARTSSNRTSTLAVSRRRSGTA